MHKKKLKEGTQKFKAEMSKNVSLQNQLNKANKANRMLQAQLEKKPGTNTVLQAHREDSEDSDMTNLAYYKIDTFVSHHLFKYADYILQQQM